MQIFMKKYTPEISLGSFIRICQEMSLYSLLFSVCENNLLCRIT